MLKTAYDGSLRASTLFLAGAALALLSGCGRSAPPVPPKIDTIIDLTNALADAGVEAAWIGEAVGPTIPILGHEYLIGRATIQLYEFETATDRQLVSDAIGADGTIEGVRLAAWEGQPSIWAAGRLLVLYAGLDGGTVLLLSGLLGDPLTAEAPAVDEPYPPAVLAAIGTLAERSGDAPGSIQVVRYEAVEWSDSCLGLPQLDEACAEAITPGWLIILRIGTDEHVFHSDELGQAMKEE